MLKRLILLSAIAACGTLPASAQTTVLGPAVTSVSVAASAILAALPANPSRKALTICNGSATLFITFTTGTVTPVSLTGGQILQPTTSVLSCFTMGAPGLAASSGIGAQINVIGSGAGPTNVSFIEYF